MLEFHSSQSSRGVQKQALLLKHISEATIPVADFFKFLLAEGTRSGRSPRWRERHAATFKMFCLEFGKFVECSKGHEMWAERDHIDLGVLRGRKRARRVPGPYKRAIV
eukprot:1255770-Pyramimonas_sp.AAC.1